MSVRKAKPPAISPTPPEFGAYFQSNEIFKNAFQYSAIGMALTSLKGTWLKVNQKVCDILGYSEEELIQITFQDITHPEDLDLNLKYLHQVIDGKIETFNMEKRYFHKNGQIVWVLLSVSLARDTNQNPLFIISQIEDITERKLANDKLIESEKRYRIFFDNSPIPLWEEDFSEIKKRIDLLKAQGVTDFHAYFASHPDVVTELASVIKILDINQAALKLYGANSIEELIKSSEEASPGEIENNHKDFIAIAEGKTTNQWIGTDTTLSGDTLEISLSWSVISGHEHDYSRVITTTFDITERKRAKEELKSSEERYKSIVEDMPMMMCRFKPDGTLTFINLFYCQYFQKSYEQLLGSNLFDLIPEEEREVVRKKYLSLTQENPFITYEYKTYDLNGIVNWQKWTDRALFNEKGEVYEYQSIGEDITDQKATEKLREESEKRYRSLFEDSPISLWEDDYSAVKQKLDELKNEGVTDFNTYFAKHPEKTKELASLIKIVDTNQYSVTLFNAKSKSDLLEYQRKKVAEGFVNAQEFINIANGITHFEWQGTNQKLNGGLMSIKLTWSVAPGYEDDLSKVIISIIDTTEQKQAEALLQNENRIMEMIASGAELNETLNAIAKNVESLLLNAFCSILLLDKDGIHLRHGTAPSLPKEYNNAIDGIMIGDSVGSCGTAAFRKQPIIVTDIANDPLWVDYKELALQHGLQACWSTPIMNDQSKVYGTFAIYYPQVREPKQAEIEMVSRATHQAKIVIEQKLTEELREESEKRYRSLFEDSPISLWEEDFSGVKKKLDELKQAGVKDFEAYFSSHPQVVLECASLVKILNVNKASVELYNANSKENLTINMLNLLRADSVTKQFTEELIQIANGQTRFEREEMDSSLSDEPLVVSIVWSVMPGHEEDLSRVIVSIVDITERKQAEEERRILIQELGERVKELTFLHNISRIFMDDSRPEAEILQEVANAIPNAWQYPEITSARVGYNGYQYITPNFKETDWMQSEFFDLPNGELGFVQVAYLEEKPEADEGPFLTEERKMLESTIEKLRTYLRGTLSDQAIRRQLTELETLYESGLNINQLLTPQEIAQEVIGVLERNMNWHHIAIREYDQESKAVKLIGFNKPSISKIEAQDYIQKMNSLISNSTQGLSGWVTTHGKSLLVPNVNMDDRFVRTFPDINSGLYVPLKVGERVIGSISVESEIENGFSDNDERLLETLAGQAAIAIENANLINELEKRVQERTIQIEVTKRRLELATHAGQIGVWEYIPRENKAIWDERMHQIHNVAIGEFDGTSESWAKHIHSEDLTRSQMNIQLGFTQNLLLNNEHRIIWHDGTIRTLATSAITVFSEDNTPDRIIGISIDITDRKKSEEALKIANAEMENALKVKDEFLANMSHELRTPLNAILGISESLEEQIIGQLNDKQFKYVGVIKESGKHLLELINDILDISKIEAGRMELTFHPIGVEKLCQASLRMIKELAQKKNLQVSFKVSGNVTTIMGDERRLKQVLVNLLSNAVKFTEEGKQVGLEVVGSTENNEVTFSVWDTGIGIAQEDLKFLFKPFVQLDAGLAREYQGTGLGLALVAQMVRLHGGLVSASSEPDKGSTFTITLPWQPEEQNAPVKVTAELVLPNQKSEEKRKGRILLVEDTDVIVSLIKDYLTFKGYEVIVANNGKEGILLAKEKLPDIILMDVMMPIMDGFEATRQIRAEKKLTQTPIIALTALAMYGDRERCLEAGMNDYMSKPVKLNELIEIIEKYIAQG